MVEQAQNNTFTYKSWKEEVDTYTGIYVYSVFIGGVFIFAMVRSTHFFVTCMFASVKLHDDMFTSIVRAPLSFFDKNPIGISFQNCSLGLKLIDFGKFYDRSRIESIYQGYRLYG